MDVTRETNPVRVRLDKFVEIGVPVQMVENALLAVASQHSAVGDYPAVRECFDKFAGLELPERAKKRFSTIAPRLAAPPVELPGLPDYLKQQHAYADIWFVDLLEWEMDGDPTCRAAMPCSTAGNLRTYARPRRGLSSRRVCHDARRCDRATLARW